MLGWSRGKVSQYDMLDDISKDAWAIIATTFEELGKLRAETVVAEKATSVAFKKKSRLTTYTSQNFLVGCIDYFFKVMRCQERNLSSRC